MRKLWLRALVPLALLGLVTLDIVSARRQPQDLAVDSFFYETGNDEIDAVTTASITAQVVIVRSDNELLKDPVPPTQRLTTAQIKDMVYTALMMDTDRDTGGPVLAEKIARVKEEKGSCWVVVKSNMIGYPRRAGLYTHGDQTDVRVTKAVMTFLLGA